MKKFFTLIAAAMMVAGANAQGTYAIQVGDAITAGDKITSVPGVVMTFSEGAALSSQAKVLATGLTQTLWHIQTEVTTASTHQEMSLQVAITNLRQQMLVH